MTPNKACDGAGDQPGFICDWRPEGVDAAIVTAAGTVDQATAPQLDAAIAEALAHARLVLIDVHEATFGDDAGARAIRAAAASASRAGARLVVVGATDAAWAGLHASGAGAEVDVLDLAPTGRRVREADVGSGAEDAIRPFDNPVNSSILTARAMAVRTQALWFQGEDGSVGTAWAPPGQDFPVEPGTPVEVYFDEQGAVNGWRHPMSGLAVNQRMFDHRVAPAEPAIAACQGPCGVLWQAPAATRLTEHDERCLTCSGPLALR